MAKDRRSILLVDINSENTGNTESTSTPSTPDAPKKEIKSYLDEKSFKKKERYVAKTFKIRPDFETKIIAYAYHNGMMIQEVVEKIFTEFFEGKSLQPLPPKFKNKMRLMR